VRTQAFPLIGKRPVAEITQDEIVAILSPKWRETPETARRLLQRLDIIFDIAIGRGIREKSNPCAGVARNLGNQGDRVEHHRSLPWREMPAFVRDLRACSANPITRLAFEFLILRAARSGSVRRAEPQEIDWDAQLWNVPLAHMKGERPHEVPLADRAIEILRDPDMGDVGARGLLFPSETGRPLSDMTFTEVLKRIGYGDRATPHGFRSSFRTWVADTNQCRGEVAEVALAHVVKNKIEAAYRRTTYLEERTTLMCRWAAHCG
jgi:integrase